MDPAPGILDLSVGGGPLSAEHRRIVEKLLVRGAESPAIPDGELLPGGHDPRAVGIAVASWRTRTKHEHHSAAVFARLLPQLIAAGASLEHKTVALRAAMDELHHGALSAGVVRYLGGDPRMEASLTTEPLPEHAGTSPRVAALRNLLFSCCLGETIGSALLASEHELTTDPGIGRVLGQLAADETLHARLGWAYAEATVPALSAGERAEVASYLPRALGTMEAEIAARMPDDDLDDDTERALAGLGVTRGIRAREIVADVVGQAILPALATLGFDAARAWRDRVAAPTSLERQVG